MLVSVAFDVSQCTVITRRARVIGRKQRTAAVLSTIELSSRSPSDLRLVFPVPDSVLARDPGMATVRAEADPA